MSERLVVAIIVDTTNPAIASRLLGDLARLAAVDPDLDLQVLLLENPSDGPACSVIQLDDRAHGLAVERITRASLEGDLERGRYGRIESAQGRWPIATARTVLQRRAAELASRSAAAVWILDEDLRLSPLLDAVRGGRPPLSARVRQLRDERIDVAVGPALGSPPVPARAAARVNLEDVRRHLDDVDRIPPGASWPDRAAENARTRAALPEYYYDLSRAHGDAGARPMWFEPCSPDETVQRVFARLCDAVGGLVDGIPVTRALPESALLEEARSPLARGGNTLVLRPELLSRIPNLAPRIGGRVTRRSDMLWARLAESLLGARFSRGLIVTLHDRRGPGRSSFDADKLVDDLRGSALVAALDLLLDTGQIQRRQRPSAAAIEHAGRLYVARAEERLDAIRRSEARALDLLDEILARTGPGTARGGFLSHPAHRAAIAGLRAHAEGLRVAYGSSVVACDPRAELPDVTRFFSELLDEIDAYDRR